MLLVKRPDKSTLVDVLRGLQASRYTREEVVTWHEAVVNQFGDDIPLNVEDGYWYFRSLSLLDVPVNFGEGQEYFIREQDIEEYILDMEQVPCTEAHGNICRIRSHEADHDQIRWPLVIYEQTLGRGPETLGLRAVRGVFEAREDLVEHTHLLFDDSLYLLVRQYDENIDQLMVLGTSRDEDKLRTFVDELRLVT